MTLLTAFSLCASLLSPMGQAQASQVATADVSAIQWFLPADLDAALARAKAENRLLLINGVSFGIDEAGASCATIGTW